MVGHLSQSAPPAGDRTVWARYEQVRGYRQGAAATRWAAEQRHAVVSLL